MIDNLKLGIKSMRYAYGLKMNAAVAALCIGLSIFCYIVRTKVDMDIFGDYMMMCIALLPVQLLFSLNASNMVAASPVRKKMQTSVPAVIACSTMMAVYLIIAAIRVFRVWRHPELMPEMGGELIRAAIIMVLFMAYLGIAYKFFYLSMFFVIATVLVLSSFMRSGTTFTEFHLPWSQDGWGMAISVLAGLGMIVAGAFLQYLIARLCYRHPLSKMAQAASLRREL